MPRTSTFVQIIGVTIHQSDSSELGFSRAKAFNKNLIFITAQKHIFKNFFQPPDEMTASTTSWPCVSQVPRVPGRGHPCHSPLLGTCTVQQHPIHHVWEQHKTLPRAHLSPELKSSTSAEIRDSLWGFRGDVQHALHFITADGTASPALAMKLPSNLQPWLLPVATTLPPLLVSPFSWALLPTHTKGWSQEKGPPCLAVLIHLSKVCDSRADTTQQSTAVKGGVPGIKFSKTMGKVKEEQGSNSQC